MAELNFGWRVHFVADYHLPGKFQEVKSAPNFTSPQEAQADLMMDLLSNPKDYSPNYTFWIDTYIDGKFAMETLGPLKS